MNESSINTLIEEEEAREQKKLKRTFLFIDSQKETLKNDLNLNSFVFCDNFISFTYNSIQFLIHLI